MRVINLTEMPLKKPFHLSENEILEEQEWVKSAQKNPEAFDKLYDRYFDGIFQFVFRRTDDEEVAEDVTSQTFLKALQNLKRYEFRGLPFSAWLFRIASNEVKKYYRRKQKQLVFSLEESPMYKMLEEAGHSADGEEKEERLQRVVVFLKELSTDDLAVLELRFFEEKSFKEIAYILEISESGAKMRTYRAVERLKKFFLSNCS